MSGVKLIAGDFDGDGDADLAAVGNSSWTTVAFALSNGRGGFVSANLPLPDFPGWASAARFVLAGKEDSGKTSDLILAGGAGWTTVPVAFLKP